MYLVHFYRNENYSTPTIITHTSIYFNINLFYVIIYDCITAIWVIDCFLYGIVLMYAEQLVAACV